jgi:uncharacterized protein YaaN involved in tellurite resistance
MYIVAGKKKLEDVRAADLAAAKDKAQKSGLPEDAQSANDLANMCTRFEKKLYDLELTRNISIQMAPQIRMIQNNDSRMAQRAVSDTTNELLKKNADALKLGTLETAKESERGIVDIETLQYTNQSLISTLDEVLKIQQEGKEKRAAAEAELARIEGELKNKLLEMRG